MSGIRGSEVNKWIDDGGPHQIKVALKRDPDEFSNRAAAEAYLKTMQLAEPDTNWVLYERDGIHFVKRRDDLRVGFVPS
jgi:hypothetical protein